ncbi:MAG TPA: ABC transporter ATP-binding protein [Clostridia bacterium]|nr:ABC transporter ATP-binding protein [Clostridia bacterium]
MELKIENLTKEFQNTIAVNHISYTMKNGVYGLLGANGAGKTTLMRMMCTLVKPSGGRITLDGKDIWELDSSYRKILGYLPQEFGYYPDFSAEDYLMYIASIKGIKAPVAKKRAFELLHRVGLENVGNKKIKKYSGGMKRRLGIAQAILNDPPILILDEPTAGLDPNERIRFRNLISELAEKRLVLLSTHIVSDVEYIADNILLMKAGNIECEGSLQKLIDSTPARVWTCNVNKQDANTYMKKFKVINVKPTTYGTSLRLLYESQPCADAKEEEMTLEDVFFYYFGEKAGDADVVL